MSTFGRLRSPDPPLPSGDALLAGVFASVVYPMVAIGFAAAVGPKLSLSGGFFQGYLISVVFALGTIGVPVVSWLRFGYRGPVAVMSVVVVLWTFVWPLVAPGSGDAPAFTLVLYWAPYYLVVYAVIAGGEYLYRRWRTSHDSVEI